MKRKIDMIRALRIKFIGIIALMMSAILIVEILSINVLTRKIGMMQTESYLSKIAQSADFDTIEGMRAHSPEEEPPVPPEEGGGYYEASDQGTVAGGETGGAAAGSGTGSEAGGTASLSDDAASLENEGEGSYLPEGAYSLGYDWSQWSYGGDRRQPWEEPRDDWGDPPEPPDDEPVVTQAPVVTRPTTTTVKKQEQQKTTTAKQQTQAKTTTARQQTKTKTTTARQQTQARTTTARQQYQQKTTTAVKRQEMQPETEAERRERQQQTGAAAVTKKSGNSSATTTTTTTVTTKAATSGSGPVVGGPAEENNTNEGPPQIPEDDKHFNDNRNSVTVDYFAIVLDENDEIYRKQNMADDSTLTEEQIEYLVATAVRSGKTSGMINNYQYYAAPKSYGSVIVYTNKSAENALMKKSMYISIFVTFLAMLVLMLVAIMLSHYITRPVGEAFTKQKQFVSDASHELKTPLTVISANADLLEDEIGDNKWLGYIKSQTERMRTLVYDLLDLSRMDAAKEKQAVFERFNLSEAVTNAVLPFEGTAFELNKNLQVNIDENIYYYGNEKQIKQLAAIFLDNAMKYSNENGNVRVTLKKTKDKLQLEFFNTGCNVRDDEREKIFERFYRSDTSRARQTGGYGLGLAIAKSIMDSHKMKIVVNSVENAWMKFTISL